MIEGVFHTQNQRVLSDAVFNYYNNKRIDRNLAQSETNGLVHHHFGITGTQIAQTDDQDKIIAEIQRQETAQSDLLIDLLRIDDAGVSNVYDVGCGRGGTMFRLLDRYQNASAVGINLTEYQTNFCRDEILARGVGHRASVIQGDFMQPPFPAGMFTHAYVNEVTQYADDLSVFFERLNFVLKSGGRAVVATWCYNDEKDMTQYWRFLTPICTHYACCMHGVNEYRKAIAVNGFAIQTEMDVTSEVLDYWRLRLEWKMQSGIEPFFIKAHEADEMRYVFFEITKQG